MAVVSDSTTRPPFGIAGEGGHLVVLDASSSVLLEVQHDRGAESRHALVGAEAFELRASLAIASASATEGREVFHLSLARGGGR